MDVGALGLFVAPAVACFVLVGIHAYFGLHVLRRRILFVDLAVAQFVALGIVVASAFGQRPGSLGSTASGLTAAVLAALLFTLTRVPEQAKVPQEALVGMTFVVASAAVLLVADRIPEGAEHIKESLAGSLLWVSWRTVALDALVYAMVGLIHLAFRSRFIAVTSDPAAAAERGVRVRLWDFLFFATLGVVISLSVQVAGVLLVFTFLVVPASVGTLLADGWGGRLLAGWGFGWASSLAGLLASWIMDWPTGPAVVVVMIFSFGTIWLVKGRGL